MNPQKINKSFGNVSSHRPAGMSVNTVFKIFTAALLVFTVAVSAAFFMMYQEITHTPVFAVLNLNKVVSVNETVLASQDLKPEELSVEAKIFARRMKAEIENLQEECGCTLLVSSAVISPSKLPDYTETLLNKLGFSPAKIAKAEVIVAERMKALQSNFAKSFQ